MPSLPVLSDTPALSVEDKLVLLCARTTPDAEAIARKAMGIAAGICIYTNDKITLEKLDY